MEVSALSIPGANSPISPLMPAKQEIKIVEKTQPVIEEQQVLEVSEPPPIKSKGT